MCVFAFVLWFNENLIKLCQLTICITIYYDFFCFIPFGKKRRQGWVGFKTFSRFDIFIFWIKEDDLCCDILEGIEILGRVAIDENLNERQTHRQGAVGIGVCCWYRCLRICLPLGWFRIHFLCIHVSKIWIFEIQQWKYGFLNHQK